MRITYLATTTLAAALCLGGTMHAQSCGPVSDEAGVLQGSIKANPLIDQGADVHVVTVASLAKYGGRLLNVEQAYEKACPNWRAPNGTRKSNLITIMVAPNDRAKNIFLGSTYDGMFSGEDEINSLYSKAANSHFRSKDWTDGINATAAALNSKVTTWKNPPASEGGKIVLIIFLVLVGLVVAGLLIWWMVSSAAKRKAERRRVEAMQQKAIRARNDATDAFANMPKDNWAYASFANKYTVLSGSLNSDPNTNSLSADTYEAIAGDWDRFAEGITRAMRPGTSGTTPISSASTAPSSPPQSTQSTQSNRSRKRETWRNTHQSTPVTPTPAPTTTVINQGGGYNNSSGDLVTGMVLGEMLSDRPRETTVYREPEYRREETRESSDSGSSGSDSGWGSSSSSSDDSSSSSGSDSSWSSSDSSSSDSSSSFDSGSDSGSSGSDSSW